ncbi:MAG: phage GP46 family protein [Desulfovibrio sp.]|jgi:phage gp46-like protein|nr:phage GP46 family protein [Desulfovibrio sp.]
MDAELDPAVGDYTGKRISTLANAVYIRLMTPLGSWWADPTVGSRLHELQRNKDLDRIRVLARQYAQSALDPLVRDKRARSVHVQTYSPEKDQSGAGRCLLLIEVEDNLGNRESYSYQIKVG